MGQDMCTVHAYLLKHGMTQEKVPSARIVSWQHACLLITILYPGYPVARAREQAVKEDRLNRVPKATPELAYDQLPTADSLERLDQLVRLDLTQKADTASIPIRSIETFLKKKRKYKRNFRLHLYLWSAEWTILPPRCKALYLDSKNEWTEEDEHLIQRGFMHIDLTEKADWATLFKQSKKEVSLRFEFSHGIPGFKFLSLCIVWEKSPAELVGQVYMQSATKRISRAMRSAEDSEKIQKEALLILQQCPLDDRYDLEKAEKVFDNCASTFHINKDTVPDDDEEEEEEILMGDQRVSVCDPILLSRIEHPARSVYCTHVACFDALAFFKCEVGRRTWQCPYCSVQIRSIEELYIDYRVKQALVKYPDVETLTVRNGEYVSTDMDKTPLTPAKAEPTPSYQAPSIIHLEDDNDDDDDEEQEEEEGHSPAKKRPRTES
ncbi:SUMO ligase siz1 [Apophysomyces ossiformis]|uniref:SUMO ligase siz1 n=1 Tax=Apophysomyces ossiformis TaxID=679940 RepID=A0A8H7EUX8_9FUNG|nr:SUMO ligase siz1 [Apophysomyces ossiformis]